MIGLRQPNKLPYASKGGLWDSSLRNIVRGLRRWLKKGRQRLTRIAPGLFGIADGTGYVRVCRKEMGSRALTQSVKKSKRQTPSQADSPPVTPNQEGGGNGKPYSA